MRFLVILLASFMALPASAQMSELERMSLAGDLATVLASEEGCELSYDQGAIEAFIDERVDADDMGFASNLGLMTSGAARRFQQLSQSGKTAHCAQIRRVARSYGFID